LISIQPASGMISSLGSGMHALSIAINTTTPGHSMALYVASMKSSSPFSTPWIASWISSISRGRPFYTKAVRRDSL
jgi:hypothetical protein